MIKRLLFALLLICGVANAAGINWEKSYAEAIAKAKTQNKPVMFIVSSHNCRYCVILEKEALSDPAVIKAVNKDFVSAIVFTDGNDVFPNELLTGGTPTIWYLKPSGEPLFQPLMGAVGAEQYLQDLGVVVAEFAKIKK